MLSRTVRGRSTSILLVFVAAGFALLLGELLMIGHVNQIQMVGVIASGVGLVLSLLAFLPSVGLRRIIIGLFVVLALAGLFGVFIHLGGRARRQTQLASVQVPAGDRLLQRALTSFRRNPPLVPPLALSGLSALGIVALLGAGAPETQARRQEQLAAVPE